jgi:transcriptional regulator with XRE-family HTH domain
MIRSISTNRQERLQEFLRQVRIEANLRQIDVATRLGVPQSFVSKYESGVRRLDLVELGLVCAAVGIALTEFVSRFERADHAA